MPTITAPVVNWLAIPNMAVGIQGVRGDRSGSGMDSRLSFRACSIGPYITQIGGDTAITVTTMTTGVLLTLHRLSAAVSNRLSGKQKIDSPAAVKPLTVPTQKPNKPPLRWREHNRDSNPKPWPGRVRGPRPPVTAVPVINHRAVHMAASKAEKPQ